MAMHRSMIRTLAVMRKELLHILRDPQTLFIVLMMPAVMMFLYGYALDAEVDEIAIAIEDPAGTALTRHIIAGLDAGPLFRVIARERVIGDPNDYFRTSRVKAIIRFEANFTEKTIQEGTTGAVQALVDGSDPNTGTIIRNAVRPAVMNQIAAFLNQPPPDPVAIRQTVLYNPQQHSALFFVPGLMVIILTMISALLTSITLTREKEHGTLSQLRISPLRSHEIILGKLLPYVGLAGLDGILVLLIGRIVFSVSIAGNAAFLAVASVIYIILCLGIGLFISTIAPRQIHAMLGAIIVTLMPSVVLTGFVFPVSSMPHALRIVSKLIPATHYLTIVRGVMLKGVGLGRLWAPLVVISLISLALLTVSIRKFRSVL